MRFKLSQITDEVERKRCMFYWLNVTSVDKYEHFKKQCTRNWMNTSNRDTLQFTYHTGLNRCECHCGELITSHHICPNKIDETLYKVEFKTCIYQDVYNLYINDKCEVCKKNAEHKLILELLPRYLLDELSNAQAAAVK